MNRYMPLVILVVFGQAAIAYLLVDRLVVQRLRGPEPQQVEEVKAAIPIGDEPDRVYRDLGDFLVNPADTSGAAGLRFLKADISLGVSPARAYDQLADQKPRLRDAIIRILTSKTVSEIDDPEDREYVKDEIRFAANRMLTQGEVLKVYFTQFFIQ